MPTKFELLTLMLKNGHLITLRLAASADSPALITYMKEMLKETDHLLMSDGEFNPAQEEELQWIKSFEDPSKLLLVATYEGEIIGNLGLSGGVQKKITHTAGLGLSVRQKWQNMGVGSALLRAGIDWARTAGFSLLWLEVTGSNARGIAVYEKLGFKHAGRLEGFFNIHGKPEDKLMMTLKL